MSKRKRLFPLLMMAVAWLPIVGNAATLTRTINPAELTDWIGQAYEQEIASLAKTQRWSEHQLDYHIRIPSSAKQLKACESPLQIDGRDHQDLPIGNLKRAVSCQDAAQPWRINITIRSHLTLPVLIVTAPIERDAAISANQVELRSHTLNRGQAVLTQLTQIDGVRAARRLRAGQVLLQDHLKTVPLVMKGNELLLIASRGGFQASMKGIALQEGHLGEQIEVKNLSSGKLVRATVIGRNQVQTQF